MTREEEIEKILDDEFDTDLYDYKTDNSYCNYCAGFRRGVEWADEHPNINSLWHTPDDPPEPKKRLIIHCDEEKEWNPIDQLVYCVNSKYSWDETVKIYNILHWAYATDLVPNFNEDL